MGAPMITGLRENAAILAREYEAHDMAAELEQAAEVLANVHAFAVSLCEGYAPGKCDCDDSVGISNCIVCEARAIIEDIDGPTQPQHPPPDAPDVAALIARLSESVPAAPIALCREAAAALGTLQARVAEFGQEGARLETEWANALRESRASLAKANALLRKWRDIYGGSTQRGKPCTPQLEEDTDAALGQSQ